MLYLCHIKCLRMIIVDLYTHLAVDQAFGEQLFMLLKSEMQVPMQADRGGTKSALPDLILV